MELPTAFVSFSSADAQFYRTMRTWRPGTSARFRFTDCQIAQEIHTNDETHIKALGRERIEENGYYISLIGDGVNETSQSVQWLTEVAIERKCTIVAINLNGATCLQKERTPKALIGVGAIFVPFSATALRVALEKYQRHEKGNWHYKEELYTRMREKNLA
jgi:hypothetical protein